MDRKRAWLAAAGLTALTGAGAELARRANDSAAQPTTGVAVAPEAGSGGADRGSSEPKDISPEAVAEQLVSYVNAKFPEYSAKKMGSERVDIFIVSRSWKKKLFLRMSFKTPFTVELERFGAGGEPDYHGTAAVYSDFKHFDQLLGDMRPAQEE